MYGMILLESLFICAAYKLHIYSQRRVFVHHKQKQFLTKQKQKNGKNYFQYGFANIFLGLAVSTLERAVDLLEIKRN